MAKKDPLLSYTCNVVNLSHFDNSKIRKAVLPRTESDYERALMIFDKFLELHPEAKNPPDLQTCKGFLVWVAKGKPGRIESLPTLETMQGFRRDFQAGISRIRDIEFSAEFSTTLKEFIIGDLRKEVPISTAEMDHSGLSPNEIIILLTQLWCRDSHEFRGEIPDRTRVQLSAAMLLYCFTSARTGEVHESTARRGLARMPGEDETDKELEARVMAACYKHFTLTIESVDNMPMLVLTYTRKFVKGYWRKKTRDIPVHAFYETYTEDVSLFLNFLTFFLPMASADKAFRDYSSVGEILDQANAYAKVIPSENKVLEVIHFAESVHETPVFRQYRELDVDKSTGKARGADAFGKEFVDLGHRSGYTRNITIRACRRWALMQAGRSNTRDEVEQLNFANNDIDKAHSESARMRFAGQNNRDTYGRFYAHPVSEIDGPANYLGITSRSEHIENRRGMGMYQNSHLFQSLPAKAEFEFLDRSDIRALDEEMRSLSARLLTTTTPEERYGIQIKQKLAYSNKQRLYKEELQRLRATQSNKPPDSNENQVNMQKETLFSYRRRVMPQRDLLANILPNKISLRHHDGRRALEALEFICKDKRTVAYRAALQPQDGKCLCGKAIDEFHSHRKWLHLYRCHKRNNINKGCHFAEMCFDCDRWFTTSSEWEDHCQEHLENPDGLLRCDPLMFRNAPIKAGFCPFCLGNKKRLASKRMIQFVTSSSEWYSHIEDHLRELRENFRCEHPACSLSFNSLEALTYHLMDTHCWRPRRESSRKRKFKVDDFP